ncbi:uncharacterized protein EDB91DRAFT_1252740 [Suillus paluster]|uniref:uncharacterized protein n=1 Tax=Suillus paluster TaxID=48578 RepID=UPI001B868811|nr:uncharacterized protein EDB91DRAFT_1252740 [Suillus paluster]KAG1730264.1 hypothetical protein EDB91DRAFT_1252740 [Suillus paluster]
MSSAPSFMPPSTSDIAPQFTGIASELLPFFHEVVQLADLVELSDPAHIKAALRYTDRDEADLWTYQEESRGDNYEEFANAVLRFYPEVRGTRYYRQEPVEVIIDEASEVKSPTPVPSTEVPACITDDPLPEESVHGSDILDPSTDKSTFIDELSFFDDIESSAIPQASDSGSDTYPQIIAPLASLTRPLIDSNPSDRTTHITTDSALSDFPSAVFTLHDPSSLPVLRVVTEEAGVMDVDFPSAVLTVPFILQVPSILRPGLSRRHLEFSSTFPSNDFQVIRDVPNDRMGLLALYSCSHPNDPHQIECSSNLQLHEAYRPVTHVSSTLSTLQIALIRTLPGTTHAAIQVQGGPPSHASGPSNTTRPNTYNTGIHPDERIPHIAQQSYWYQVHPSATPIIPIAPHHHALNPDRQTQEYISLGTSPPSEYNISDPSVTLSIHDLIHQLPVHHPPIIHLYHLLSVLPYRPVIPPLFRSHSTLVPTNAPV